MQTRRWSSETGSVTAELAMTLPAVTLIISITLGAFALQIERMKLVDAAASSARALARGEPEPNALSVATQMLGLSSSAETIGFEIENKADFTCVKINQPIRIPSLGTNLFELIETQCARKMGQ